jgi:hypothetical protein
MTTRALQLTSILGLLLLSRALSPAIKASRVTVVDALRAY